MSQFLPARNLVVACVGPPPPGVSRGRTDRIRPGCGPVRRHPGQGQAPESVHMVAGRIHFLEGCWIKGLGWRETVISFLPQGPVLRAAHSAALGFHEGE